jgi:hypothetical protein
MNSVSRGQIERAKKIDLLTYLQIYEPDAIFQSGANEYRLKEHDSLVISNGLWHWTSAQIGGRSALDFLIKVRGFDFVSAVEKLCGCRAPPDFIFQTAAAAAPKNKAVFTLPAPNWNNSRVTAYLQNRGIDGGIIDDCIQNGTLYESRKYKNAVFIGRDSGGIPRFACVRSTVNNFRRDIEGSDKRFSFRINSDKNDSRFVIAAEAPIDILSVATLMKTDGKDYKDYNYLSLDGTSDIALAQYLADNPQTDRVILSLDNDSAGRKAAEKIKEMLEKRHITVINEPPPAGNDFNDALLAVIRKQREEAVKSRGNADIFI